MRLRKKCKGVQREDQKDPARPAAEPNPLRREKSGSQRSKVAAEDDSPLRSVPVMIVRLLVDNHCRKERSRKVARLPVTMTVVRRLKLRRQPKMACTAPNADEDEEMAGEITVEKTLDSSSLSRYFDCAVRSWLTGITEPSYAKVARLGDSTRLTAADKAHMKLDNHSIWVGMKRESKNQKSFYHLDDLIHQNSKLVAGVESIIPCAIAKLFCNFPSRI